MAIDRVRMTLEERSDEQQLRWSRELQAIETKMDRLFKRMCELEDLLSVYDDTCEVCGEETDEDGVCASCAETAEVVNDEYPYVGYMLA